MPYKDRAKQNAYQNAWLRQRREEWLKANGPCARCGSDQNLRVDHVDPKKKKTHRVWSYTKKRREAELAKCQVLCHACHVEKTAEERGHAKHGTEARYSSKKWRCRCAACREGHRRYAKEWRRRKRRRISCE